MKIRSFTASLLLLVALTARGQDSTRTIAQFTLAPNRSLAIRVSPDSGVLVAMSGRTELAAGRVSPVVIAPLTSNALALAYADLPQDPSVIEYEIGNVCSGLAFRRTGRPDALYVEVGSGAHPERAMLPVEILQGLLDTLQYAATLSHAAAAAAPCVPADSNLIIPADRTTLEMAKAMEVSVDSTNRLAVYRGLRIRNAGVPRYPDGARSAHTPGRVLVKYAVDASGKVDMTSVQIQESTDDRFSQSVREALRETSYYPATVNGRAVRLDVVQPFDFQVP